MGFSPEWVKMAKRSIMTLLPRFNSERMVGEYLSRFYVPASQRGQEFARDGFNPARDLAAWKRKVRSAWPHVQLRAPEAPKRHAQFGDKLRFTVAVKLDKLAPEDVAVELLLATALKDLAVNRPAQSFKFTPTGARNSDGEVTYILDLAPEICGKLEYRIRAYPTHPALSHPFEMGLMKWI
jgi:starch phosphorylase